MTRFFALLFLGLCAIAPAAFAQAPLRAGDAFELQLSGMPAEFALDFRGQYTIGDDGTVSIPLIGPVRAVGLTSSQLARAIEKKLVDEQIFTHPTVLLALPIQSRFVTVGGAVRAPQAVAWTADMTLSTAIKRAGGTSDFANMKRVRLTRDGKVAILDLRRADKDPNQNPRLLPGDEVEVPE